MLKQEGRRIFWIGGLLSLYGAALGDGAGVGEGMAGGFEWPRAALRMELAAGLVA